MATITPTVKSPDKTELQDIVLAFIPPARTVGIRLDYQKPETFESSAAQKEWEQRARNEAEQLRQQLENGEVSLVMVRDRIILNPPEKLKQEEYLYTEREIVQLSMELRRCLGINQANTVRCIEILQELKKCRFGRLMLLRNPDCVDCIRRMMRYIGNLGSWNLSAEAEEKFKVNAEIIRKDAAIIYKNFKKPFFTTRHDFWDMFCNLVEEYESVTKNIPISTCMKLSLEEYDQLLENKRIKNVELDDALMDKDTGDQMTIVPAPTKLSTEITRLTASENRDLDDSKDFKIDDDNTEKKVADDNDEKTELFGEDSVKFSTVLSTSSENL